MTTEKTDMNFKFNDQTEFWDLESSGKSYCSTFISSAESNKWIDMLLNIEKSKNITVSGKVLEIGGGSQYLSRYIAKSRDSSVICTDVSPQRIEDFNIFYNEDLPNLQTGSVNAERLPYEDNTFDFIVGEAVLHHIEDLRSALLEINRCLKPNGKAIFLREPIVGQDTFIKRPVKKILSKFNSGYLENYELFIVQNRYEFDRTYFQWKEEFERTGFKSTFYKGWYDIKSKSVYQSNYPMWFSCLVSICLEKKINTVELDWSKL